MQINSIGTSPNFGIGWIKDMYTDGVRSTSSVTSVEPHESDKFTNVYFNDGEHLTCTNGVKDTQALISNADKKGTEAALNIVF